MDTLESFQELMQSSSPAPAPDEQSIARRRRAGRIVGGVFLVIVLAVAGYAGWAAVTPAPAPTVQMSLPSAPVGDTAAVVLPEQGASALSVAGADDYLGAEAAGVWMRSGDDSPRPMASITKLVTALVILDRHPLGAGEAGPTITFGPADRALYDRYYVLGATIAPMPRGTSMSLHDALATMLIPSASNYADAVSTWAFGSRERFLAATREWLAANALATTTVVDPTGLDPRNTSTPADLLVLGRLAHAHPVVARITALPYLEVEGPGGLRNTNDLLGTEGIDGLKTGTLGPDTHNLLFTAELEVGTPEPLSVTGVVLGAASRAAVQSDVVAMLRDLRLGFREVLVIEGGTEVGSATTAWGTRAALVAAYSASLFTWSDTSITLAHDAQPPAELVDGAGMGLLTWTAGPDSAESRVVLSGELGEPTLWWRLTHPLVLLGAD